MTRKVEERHRLGRARAPLAPFASARASERARAQRDDFVRHVRGVRAREGEIRLSTLFGEIVLAEVLRRARWRAMFARISRE